MNTELPATGRIVPNGPELWTLLHDLDDPNHVEYPAGFRNRPVRERFKTLAAQLDAMFGCACTVEGSVEDASYHDRIDIPANATTAGESLTIVVSNFGNMAVLCVGNPGAYDEEESQLFLDPGDGDRIRQLLTDLGYVVVPEHPLWTRYDGTVGFLREHNDTWWDRYFSYL